MRQSEASFVPFEGEQGVSVLPQSVFRSFHGQILISFVVLSLVVTTLGLAIALAAAPSSDKNSSTPSSPSQPTSLGDRILANIFMLKALPLSVADAETDGWEHVGSSDCNNKLGVRYRLGTRLTPTLIFGANGHLAGFQIAAPSATFPLYPATNLRLPHVQDMSTYGDPGVMAVSFYIVDPITLCTPAAPGPPSGSVGDRLWVRVAMASQAQIDFEPIPLTEAEVVAAAPTNGYIASGCAPSGFAGPGTAGMGTHYWRYLGKDNTARCEHAGPYFLLYAQGQLHGIGMTFVGLNLQVPTVNGTLPIRANNRWIPPNTELWEFAQQPLYPYFFHKEQNPICLQNLNQFNESLPNGAITTGTLHIFFRDPFHVTC